LGDYLRAPDPSYHATVGSDGGDLSIDLVSQTWQGHPWEHKVIVRDVPAPVSKGIGVLFITGSGPRPGDRALIPLVTNATKLPTAFLFSIPNQPLYDFSEDDLIAYTFDKYLETKDATWPLLFPMTKSVLRAMDAIEEATKNSANPIHRFIISGASKRGWTTWLSGASGDQRIVGIAPMVIDNLNLAKQMKHQMELWGKYSEQIEAYTKRGLQAKFASDEGRHLGEIVDPYAYRSQIKVPTLIITGANDPYWAADACRQYYSDLKQPKWMVTVPNVGHNLGGGAEAIETLGAFCRSVAGGFAMPHEGWDVKQTDATHVRFRLRTSGLPVKRFTIWLAQKDDFDFKTAKYTPVVVQDFVKDPKKVLEVTMELPAHTNSAVFAEATYNSDRTFRLCCPITIFRGH
jgi:PhoPQ-activated pathogenicity-related protein